MWRGFVSRRGRRGAENAEVLKIKIIQIRETCVIHQICDSTVGVSRRVRRGAENAEHLNQYSRIAAILV